MNKIFAWKLAGIALSLMALSGTFGFFLTPHAKVNCTEGASSLAQILVGCWGSGLGGTLVKVASVIVLTFPLMKLIGILMSFEDYTELKEQQLTSDYNDSPVIFAAFGVLALVFLVNELPFTTLLNYMDYLMWKSGFALLLTLLFSFLSLRFVCDITVMAVVNDQMRKTGTNAVAIWIGISMVAAAILV